MGVTHFTNLKTGILSATSMVPSALNLRKGFAKYSNAAGQYTVTVCKPNTAALAAGDTLLACYYQRFSSGNLRSIGTPSKVSNAGSAKVYLSGVLATSTVVVEWLDIT